MPALQNQSARMQWSTILVNIQQDTTMAEVARYKNKSLHVVIREGVHLIQKSTIRGHHIFIKVWTPSTGEELPVNVELHNAACCSCLETRGCGRSCANREFKNMLVHVLPSQSRQPDSLSSNRPSGASTLNLKGKDWLFLVATSLLANRNTWRS